MGAYWYGVLPIISCFGGTIKLLLVKKNGKPIFAVQPIARDTIERNYYTNCEYEEIEGCGYDLGAGWHPAKCANPEPCPEHKDIKCTVCGKLAKWACGLAESIAVCGAPLCEDHRNEHHHR